MNLKRFAAIVGIVIISRSPELPARVVTLGQCRDSALVNNVLLEQAGIRMDMAAYDRKIAAANYFPSVSVTGTYQYNSRNFNLLDKDISDALEQLDRILPGDAGQIIDGIGSDIVKAFELDVHNVYAGCVSVLQPVFAGGKIVAANRIASLESSLERSKYETQQRKIISDVDNSYWQVVSIASRCRLAEEYSAMLEEMVRDAEIMEKEGVMTNADVLSLKVRNNEAEMLLAKAGNGLVLSKMLLCKLCGMDYSPDLVLEDEDNGPGSLVGEVLPLPMQEIYEARPEIRSLEYAGEMYDAMAVMQRAEMLPKIFLTANYMITNPNLFHGFSNSFSGMFNVGISVTVPIFHGMESLNRFRKAKCEAALMRCGLRDARENIALQVGQLRFQVDESRRKLKTAQSNLGSAEENLRMATLGFGEGVIPSYSVLQAQTAWLQARSECIDAAVELRMRTSELRMAQGERIWE